MLRFLRLPSRVPVRLPVRQTSQKLLATVVFAVCATAVAYAVKNTRPVDKFRENLYDTAYTLREDSDRTAGDVVIIAIDQDSLTKLNEGVIDETKVPWPWPRELYGDIVKYLDEHGAKVIAFDMLFSEIDRASNYASDETFAELVDAAKTKVVFGTLVTPQGNPGPFAPPVKAPDFGAVNVNPEIVKDGVLRKFDPFVKNHPSLAYRAAEIFSGSPSAQRDRFRMHFYGAHRRSDGQTTYRYVTALSVLAATRGAATQAGIDESTFKNKIVLIGGTAPGLYDAKATPLDGVYPGVEWQATAIENILFRQRVQPVPAFVALIHTFLGALLAAAGAIIPTRAVMKVATVVMVVVAVIAISLFLFLGEPIRWLPLAVPLIAILISALTALAWSYFTEGRQRLFISKAFALSTSPVIAEAISKNPEKLKLGGERREITVMFTDLAGFTDLSETMEVVKLAQVINLYMEAMSEEIVRRDGYLDKYIGDAIMSFWNGLIDQPDHAARACRAALGIKRRELEIAPELQKLVEAKIVTRIGVNTGPMAVGNLGSSRKLSYTVLGDAVNLGARLEPANKLYDTEVIISQATADQVKGQFLVRELDLLAVKGKTIPMAVYELMAEGDANGQARARVEMYAAGLAHYRKQRWDEAEAAWNRLLKEFPTDGPAAKMLARVAKLRHESLPPDWDGVYRSKEK
jgi:adenylate cyclase